jgi:LPS-assembly protein
LEFNPQIRTDRSVGLYATYRFADSPVSFGQLRVGYFKDKSSYVDKYDLPEDRHYGLQFVYDRGDIWGESIGENYDDGLYIDVTLLNDIDYLNLQKSSIGIFGQSPLQQSVFNYYIDNNEWYGGINAKYFIDTRLASNAETIQTLPTLQAHKYLRSIFSNDVTYALDLQMRNLYRRKGTTMKQIEVRVPIDWTMTFLDGYASITLSESLYFGTFDFNDDRSLTYRNFTYVNNVHQAELFTDLTGRIGDYIHVVQPSVTYVLPGNEITSPVSAKELFSIQPQVKELFSVGLPEEEIRLSFGQYVYDETMRLIFFQRLRQRYYPDRIYEAADLENEMALNLSHWRFYSFAVYSHEYGSFRQASGSATYEGEGKMLTLGHTWKRDFDRGETLSNDLYAAFRYEWSERVAFYGRWNYDLEESGLDRWSFGTEYKRDCWSLGATIGADIRPLPTTADGRVDYTQEYTFYVQLNFIPFGGVHTSGADIQSGGFDGVYR